MTTTPAPDHPGFDAAPDQGAVSAFNVPGSHVQVRHETTGGLWDCPVDYLPQALEKGWHPLDAVEVAAGTAYDGLTVAELRDLIDARNDALPDGSSEDLVLSKSGPKADLITTLLADDARRGNPA